jgi:YD repeat-containing protein
MGDRHLIMSCPHTEIDALAYPELDLAMQQVAERNGVPKGLRPTSKSYAGQVVDIYRPGLWQWDWHELGRLGEHLDLDS